MWLKWKIQDDGQLFKSVVVLAFQSFSRITKVVQSFLQMANEWKSCAMLCRYFCSG